MVKQKLQFPEGFLWGEKRTHGASQDLLRYFGARSANKISKRCTGPVRTGVAAPLGTRVFIRQTISTL